MKNILEKYWPTIRLIMINWTLFVLLLSALGNYLMLGKLKDLDQCKADWDRLGKKIENGEVVVKSEQTLTIDRQGQEVK